MKSLLRLPGRAPGALPKNERYAGGGWHVALIALIAAYLLIFPIYRGFFPLEIAPNEGWNAYYQDAAYSAGPLYPSPDQLIVNNYPPLSFYAIGWIASWAGDALFVGRALSVVALFGLAFLIAMLIRQLGSGWIAGALGGVWFVATIAGPFGQFVAMNDPQLFGQFLMACALFWFLVRDARGLSAEPPILLMVVAGFWKHNIIAIPATVLLWLALRDGRHAVRPWLFAMVAAAVGLLICVAVYGNAFLANILVPRLFVPSRMLLSLGRLQFVAPALIVWAIWAWRERATTAARFTALFIGIALIAHIVQWSADAVVNNSQFDLVIAAAIGLGLAYNRAAVLAGGTNWSGAQMRAVIVAIVTFRLLATGNVASALILFDPHYRYVIAAHADRARQEAARVARIPGLVGCSNKVVCRTAGKQFVYDDFKVGEMLKMGRITDAGLSQLMRQRGIVYIDIDPRAHADSLSRDIFQKPWQD